MSINSLLVPLWCEPISSCKAKPSSDSPDYSSCGVLLEGLGEKKWMKFAYLLSCDFFNIVPEEPEFPNASIRSSFWRFCNHLVCTDLVYYQTIWTEKNHIYRLWGSLKHNKCWKNLSPPCDLLQKELISSGEVNCSGPFSICACMQLWSAKE